MAVVLGLVQSGHLAVMAVAAMAQGCVALEEAEDVVQEMVVVGSRLPQMRMQQAREAQRPACVETPTDARAIGALDHFLPSAEQVGVLTVRYDINVPDNCTNRT